MLSNEFEIFLLTGFLGSGKTTLLKSFLESCDATDIGVIVNEIGNIDVDGAVLAQSAKKVPLVLLTNGCICCAPNGDLAGTIAMLHEERARRSMPYLRRVIVETSGIARPGPVLRELQLLGSSARTICLSTFDAQDWERAVNTREGRAQLAGAQRVVITKLDSVTNFQVQQAYAAVRCANPLAEVVEVHTNVERAHRAFASYTMDSPRIGLDQPYSDDHGTNDAKISAALVRFEAPIDYDELTDWLANAAGLLGDRLYRVKGFVRVSADRTVLVQGVGTTFAQPLLYPVHQTHSFLIVIGEDLKLEELRSVEPSLHSVSFFGKNQLPTAIGRSLHNTLSSRGQFNKSV